MIIHPANYFPESLQRVANLSELRDLTVIGAKLGDPVLLEGSVQPGDLKGGLYVWVNTSRYPDDGIFIIKPDAFSDIQYGRWHAVYRDRSQADKHRINFQITFPSPQLAEKVLIYAMPEEIVLYKDFEQTQFTRGTAPVGDYQFTVWKNNAGQEASQAVQIGTIIVHQDNTWTGSTGGIQVRFQPGDRLEIRANGPADTPLGFFAFTILGEYVRVFTS